MSAGTEPIRARSPRARRGLAAQRSCWRWPAAWDSARAAAAASRTRRRRARLKSRRRRTPAPKRKPRRRPRPPRRRQPRRNRRGESEPLVRLRLRIRTELGSDRWRQRGLRGTGETGAGEAAGGTSAGGTSKGAEAAKPETKGGAEARRRQRDRRRGRSLGRGNEGGAVGQAGGAVQAVVLHVACRSAVWVVWVEVLEQPALRAAARQEVVLAKPSASAGAHEGTVRAIDIALLDLQRAFRAGTGRSCRSRVRA